MAEKQMPTMDEFEVQRPVAENFEERMAQRRAREEKKELAKDEEDTSLTIGFRWRTPEELPKIQPVKAVFRLTGNVLVTGQILNDLPHVLDVVEMKYIKQPTWSGFYGWLPQSELPQ